MRTAYIWNPETDEDSEKEVSLADGEEWSNSVLNDLENANWHSARAAFKKLIILLPDIYVGLPQELQKRLEEATDEAWEREF